MKSVVFQNVRGVEIRGDDMKIQKNRGNAVIELSLLMPFLLGVLYLYIMMFLLFIGSGRRMAEVAETIYADEEEVSAQNISLRKEGSMRIGTAEEDGKIFTIQIELRRDENDPVENIRRWQLIGDVF